MPGSGSAPRRSAVEGIGDVVVTRRPDHRGGGLQGALGAADEAMEGVEVAARVLDVVESGRQLAQRLDRLVAHALGALVVAAHPARRVPSRGRRHAPATPARPRAPRSRRRTPNGIRTRATAVKGRGPRPLDDGGLPRPAIRRRHGRTSIGPRGRGAPRRPRVGRSGGRSRLRSAPTARVSCGRRARPRRRPGRSWYERPTENRKVGGSTPPLATSDTGPPPLVTGRCLLRGGRVQLSDSSMSIPDMSSDMSSPWPSAESSPESSPWVW